MARVLHLLPRADAELAVSVIRRDIDAGDEVTVALLPGAPPSPPALPPAAAVHRVPSEWTYEELLARIFDADRVVTW